MKKAVILFTTIIFAVFMAQAALAINQEARPETMYPDADCDDAGTFKISFTAFDYPIVNDWLTTNEFVWFRLLLGSGINPDVPFPTLCRTISGPQTWLGIGALGGNIPAPIGPGAYAVLDAIGVEVSDIDTDGVPDVSAYVYGLTGQRYIDIYVTWLDQDVIPSSSGDELPWIKIGLYEDLINATNNLDLSTTLICAKVKGMFELDQLILSNDADPDTLTVNTADDRIGIFLDTPFTVTPCDKSDLDYCDSETQIALCGDTQIDQFTFECATYQHCFVIRGDWPDRDELLNFQLTTSTPGVSLYAISWANSGTGTPGPTIYQPFNPADPSTYSGVVPNELMPVSGYHVGPAATPTGYYYGPAPQCSAAPFSWIKWRAYSLDFTSNAIRLCVSYNVNSDLAVPESIVQFSLSAWETPCGILFEDTATGPLLVECGLGLNTCIYFPYVLFGYDGEFDDLGEYWATGIAVVNIGVGTVPADMVITYALRDIDGGVWTDTKSGYTQIMEVQTVDDMIAAGGWSPTGRCGWLKATGNFLIDGFQYNYVVTVDGMMFGAAVLPRQICTLFSALPNQLPTGAIMP